MKMAFKRGDSSKPARIRNVKDMAFVKPEGREDYMTLVEVCAMLKRDPSWIRQLEKEGRIPKAHRVRMGTLRIRLWSPRQVEEIQEVLSKMKRGRPSHRA